jgi:hypothetical protein
VQGKEKTRIGSAYLYLSALKELGILAHRSRKSLAGGIKPSGKPHAARPEHPALMAPTHALLARTSLDSSNYSFINVFLKSQKLHTRTLSALFAQHATELTVLERIYYLNNNQHRPALFWQRVVEARRYSRRLRSLDVPFLVDGLRKSFYGDVADAR